MMNLSQLSQNTSLLSTNPNLLTTMPIQQNNQVSSGSPTYSHASDADPSTNNQPTSSADVTVAISKAVIEEVTEVNPKTLSKALRPPVTIKNFFKPTIHSVTPVMVPPKSTKFENDEKVLEVNSDKMPDETLEIGKLITSKRNSSEKDSETSKSSKVKKEMSYSDFKKELQNEENKNECSSVNNSDATEKNNNSGLQETRAKSEIVVLDDNSNDSSSGNSTKSSSSETSISVKPNLSKKRKLEDRSSNQPVKKSKQATLKSTFAKMETKSVTCPICSKVFEKGISNVDLNKHIDNCIIE